MLWGVFLFVWYLCFRVIVCKDVKIVYVCFCVYVYLIGVCGCVRSFILFVGNGSVVL